MIEREVVADQCRRSARDEKLIVSLLHIHRPLVDHSHETRTERFPMKNLAGIERLREIEIRRLDLGQIHSATN